jgi:RNA polymerase sigma-70 factor (ECF subfamily)
MTYADATVTYSLFVMSDDAELLQRWRSGDKAAGDALFTRHFEALRRFFRSKVSVTEVEDLLQHTLLACLESVERFRSDSSFRTYLFAIARNQFAEHLRRQGRRSRREVVDLSVTSVRDAGMSPSLVAAAHEQHALIAAAMQSIPVDFQITLELYYWEQLKGPELAEVLGISPATVRTRLHRARTALKERLAELAPQLATDDAALQRSVSGLAAVL